MLTIECLSVYAMPRDISTLHVKLILQHGRTILRDLYGWFLHLWRLFWPMSSPSRSCPRTMCRKEPDFELGKCHFM